MGARLTTEGLERCQMGAGRQAQWPFSAFLPAPRPGTTASEDSSEDCLRWQTLGFSGLWVRRRYPRVS